MPQEPDHVLTKEKAKDFFISYTQQDREWAEWIAFELERVGYTTVIQAWDSRPGTNFVRMMNDASVKSARTIVVLSTAYVLAKFGFVEWAVAFRDDPTGDKGLVIPVRIEECEIRGLLGPITYIDLVGLDEAKAREILLAGVQQERTKPDNVAFPKSSPAVSSSAGTPKNQQNHDDLASGESLLPKEANFGSPFPVLWIVPRRHNPFFTGRDAALREIAMGFQERNHAGMSPYQALVGPGGMGKTQTAAEYAYRSRVNYTAVFWVNAGAPETLVIGFRAIARQLQLREKDALDQRVLVEAVQQWLRTTSTWLLILDNADDFSQAVSFLPEAAPGHVLFTTRARATTQLAQPILLDALSPDDGAVFILRRAGYLRWNEEMSHASKVSLKAAQELSQAMMGLPLALEQAGAYIEDTGRGVQGYLELYQQERSRLQQLHSGAVPDYPEPVASAWKLSWTSIQQSDPIAANLLRLCAFLAPEAIDGQIVKGVPSALGVQTMDPLALDRALGLLRRTSLLQREVDHETDVPRLSMHRIIQQVLQDEMDAAAQQLWAERAVRAVALALPKVEWQFMQAHVQQCVQLITQWKMAFREAKVILRAIGER